MLTRWQVVAAPTSEDPMRRLLLLKASAADVQVLIRKLGAVCGRPKKDPAGAEFNFRIYLHGITEDRLPAIEADLKGMTAPGGADLSRSQTPLPRIKEDKAPEIPRAATPPPAALPEIPRMRTPPPAAKEEAKMPEIPRMATPPPAAAPEIPRMATPPPAAAPEIPRMKTPPPAAAEPRFSLSPVGPAPDIPAVTPPAEAPSVEPAADSSPKFTLRLPGSGADASAPAAHAPQATPESAQDRGASAPAAHAPQANPESAQDRGASAPAAGGGAPAPSMPGSDLVVPGRVDMPAPAPTPTADGGRFGGLGALPPKKTEPAPEPKKTPAPAKAPAAAPKAEPKPPAPVPAAEDALFGAAQRLDPLLSMETLTVSAANRFAHAATTSVISSPGGMYNPLFISGAAGTGKTHLLHALGQKLESTDPKGPVWLTTGPKLARAAALAVAQNKGGQLEEFAKKSKALLIDDVQLMGVAEQNRGLLGQLLKIFSVNGKQVVMASAYSHRMLGALEKALEYQISAGHAVELKVPPEKKRKEIALHVLERTPMNSDALSQEQFGDRILQDFGALDLAIRRILTLKDMGPGKGPHLKDMLAVVFAPDAGEAMPSSEEEIKTALSSAPALPPEGSLRTAILYPALQDTHADWIWCHLLDTARQRKWPTPFRMAHRKAYGLEQVFAAPFVVAEECYQAGVRAALVLGPPPGSDLSEHEADFRYVAEHLLRDMGVCLGWIPYSRVRDPKYAALAYLDLCRAAGGAA